MYEFYIISRIQITLIYIYTFYYSKESPNAINKNIKYIYG
jgi:hypothetical protein